MTLVARGLSSSASSPVLSQDQGGRETKVAKPGINSGTRVDLLAIKRSLPAQWMAFIRAHFRSAYEVHVFFSIDEKTARGWWEGKNAPHASAALAVVLRFPGALQALIGEAA